MFVVERSEPFAEWLTSLDEITRSRIGRRVDRLTAGAFGDVAPVGEGVSELRFHFGPGYRIYFRRVQHHLIVVLGGGDKSSQMRDVEAAKALARGWRLRND